MRPSSPNLNYRPFQEADFSDYLRLTRNVRVMRYIAARPYSSSLARQKFNEILHHNRPQASPAFFRVTSHQKGDFAGLAKMLPLEKGEAEIGYYLLPEYWGRGLGQEMVGALVELGQRLPGIRRLSACVDPKHEVSIHLLRKRGFEKMAWGTEDYLPAEWYELVLGSGVSSTKIHKL